jgi:AMMECR1 domain-containing protein
MAILLVLRGSMGLVAPTVLTHPHIAKAAAKTATL